MYQVKLLNKIAPCGLERLPRELYTASEECEAPDAVLVRSAAMHDYTFPQSLRAIARAGAGVNNIPLDRCSEAGIAVFNTPGANANAVKELTMAALLLSSRRVVSGIQWVNTLKDEGAEVPKLVEKGKGKFVGPELRGKKLGVIGLGAIGVMVANTARQMEMEVYGYDPYMSLEAAWTISRSIAHASSLREIYENCDYITLHLPQTADTKGMICQETISGMKHGVRIINLARGELVNNEDILAALEEGSVACYVTDFPVAELIGQKGVITIPHLGASTPESEDNCAVMAADELREYLENGNIKNSVNLPSVMMERSGRTRVGVIHKNVPNMISMITQGMAQNGINIENMTNKSRGDYAYTLVDFEGDRSDALVEALQKIDGVIRVSVY